MNIKSHRQKTDRYLYFNREERNLAAIFYHALLLEGNLEKFLEKIGNPFPVIKSEMAIYYEYAYLRDLWYKIGKDNELKRSLILDTIKLSDKEKLIDRSFSDFNEYFGAVPKPSDKFIQSPSNWSISRFSRNIEDNKEFLSICRFKWCFNAKPDIVIHTSNNNAICIEAKLESEEGKYPSTEVDKKIFRDREQPYVKQTEVQKMLMTNILGIETEFIMLTKKNPSNEKEIYTWREVFLNMDLSTSPKFIREWVDGIE